MLVHVPSFGRNPRSSPDFLPYPVPKAWMHVVGTWVPRRLGVARSASSSKAAQALGCSLTPRLRVTLTGSPALHGLPQCQGYGHWVSYCCVARVLGFGFRGNPAIPGLGLGCVCLGTGLWFVPPILAGVAPPLLAAVLDCVVWCAHSACTPPILAGVRGALLSVQVLAFTPPILAGVFGRACLCARSACTSPFLAQVCGVGVRAWVRVSAVPAIAGWGVGAWVFLCAFRLYHANPG